jgi:UDP-3-O-[3-hydroxymyristoyl] N-acetylglucosamine deacetylase
MKLQTTLAGCLQVEGVALHCGERTRVTLHPAPPRTGFIFVSSGVEIPARVAHVVDTQLATTVGRDGATVRTVEHLLATLRGLGVDNVRVEVEGSEIPILDGCGASWVAQIQSVGIEVQDEPQTVFEVRSAVEVRHGERFARLEPAVGCQLDVTVDFDHPSVGRQHLIMAMSPERFCEEIAWARTFGFERQVAAMQEMGLVQGGSLENALVFGDQGPLNPEGLRSPDEPVRHKLFDALGDLALLGHCLEGRLVAEMPGHGLIVSLLKAVMDRPESWRIQNRST